MKEKDKIKDQLIKELAAMRKRVAKLEKSETEHKKTRVGLEKESTAITTVMENMLSGERDDAEIEKRVLDACLVATDSVYGMVGKINEHGKYDTTTYSSQTLHDCMFSEALTWEMSTGMTIRGIWGWPMLHGKSLLCNDLYNHPDRIGHPKGHVPIQCFLGVPLKEEGKVVGIVAVANKPGGYTEEDKNTLIRLASVITVSRQHRLALIAAKKTSIELEEFVEERTKALSKSETRLRSVIESRMIGILFWDTNGNITDANDTFLQMVGYTMDDILSGKMRWRDMTPPEYREQDNKALKETAATGVMTPIEKEYIRKDGSRIPILLGAASLPGPTLNGVAFVLDITDCKKAEEKLKEYSENLERRVEERTRELQDAQEELVRKEKLAILGQLAGGVGHELRNPLGSIKNAVYFLNMTLEEPELEVKETLEILETDVSRSEKIISNLLDFARPKPPVKQKVNINNNLREVLSFTSVPENIELISQLDEKLPIVLADPSQLNQAFENIILNSIQAMPEGGRLTIKSEVKGKEWVSVSVTDSGTGIPKDDIKKIFEPLFTTKAKGIGLGLAITKTLVEGNNGTINVESEAGKGSTFIVKLHIGEKKEK